MGRFWEKVDVGDCWLWTGATTADGYGSFWLNRVQYAHRVAWELLVGPVPAGLQLDHLCRVRNCVNPDHLEPVTASENARRGAAGATARNRQKAKTNCPQGHPYSDENTARLKNGGRRCRACQREHTRRWRLA